MIDLLFILYAIVNVIWCACFGGLYERGKHYTEMSRFGIFMRVFCFPTTILVIGVDRFMLGLEWVFGKLSPINISDWLFAPIYKTRKKK